MMLPTISAVAVADPESAAGAVSTATPSRHSLRLADGAVAWLHAAS